MSNKQKSEHTVEFLKYEENEILKYQLRKEHNENKKIKKEYLKKVLSNENDVFMENKNLQTQLNSNIYLTQLIQKEKEKLQDKVEKYKQEIEQTKQECNLLIQKLKEEMTEQTKEEKINYYNILMLEKNQELQNIMKQMDTIQHNLIHSINTSLEHIYTGKYCITTIPVEEFRLLGNFHSLESEIQTTSKLLEGMKEIKNKEMEWERKYEELKKEKNDILFTIEKVKKEKEEIIKEKEEAFSKIIEINHEKEKVIKEKEDVLLKNIEVNQKKEELKKIKEMCEDKMEDLIKSNEQRTKEHEQLENEQQQLLSINEELFTFISVYEEKNKQLIEEKTKVEEEFQNYQKETIQNARNRLRNKKWSFTLLNRKKKVYSKNKEENNSKENKLKSYLSEKDIVLLLHIKKKLKKEHTIKMYDTLKQKKTREKPKEKTEPNNQERQIVIKEIKNETNVEHHNHKTGERIRKRVIHQKILSHPKKRRNNFYFYYKDFRDVLIKNMQIQKKVKEEKERLNRQVVHLEKKEKNLKGEVQTLKQTVKEKNENLIKEINESKKNRKYMKDQFSNCILGLFRLLEDDPQKENESCEKNKEEIKELYSIELVKKIKQTNQKNVESLLIKKEEINKTKEKKKTNNSKDSYQFNDSRNSFKEDMDEDSVLLEYKIGNELEHLINKINENNEDYMKQLLKKEKENFEKEIKTQLKINDNKKWEKKIEEIQLEQKKIYENKLKQMKEDETSIHESKIKDMEKKNQLNHIEQENIIREEKKKYEKKIEEIEKREKSKYELKVKQLAQEEKKKKIMYEEKLKEMKQIESEQYEKKLNQVKKEEEAKLENHLKQTQKEEKEKYETLIKELEKREQKRIQEKIEIENEIRKLKMKDDLEKKYESPVGINYANELEYMQNSSQKEKEDKDINTNNCENNHYGDLPIQESEQNQMKLKKRDPVKLKEIVDFFNLEVSDLTEDELAKLNENDFFRNNHNIFTKQETEIIRSFLNILCEWKQIKLGSFQELIDLKKKEEENKQKEEENEKKRKGIKLNIFHTNISNTLEKLNNEEKQVFENENLPSKKEFTNEILNQIKDCIRLIALVRTKNILIVNMKKNMEQGKLIEETSQINSKDKENDKINEEKNIHASMNQFNRSREIREEKPKKNDPSLQNNSGEMKISIEEKPTLKNDSSTDDRMEEKHSNEKKELLQKIKELQRMIMENNEKMKGMEENQKQRKNESRKQWIGVSLYALKKKKLKKKEKMIRLMKTDLKKIIKIQKKVKAEIRICRKQILQLNPLDITKKDSFENFEMIQILWLQEVDKIINAYEHLLGNLKSTIKTWEQEINCDQLNTKLSRKRKEQRKYNKERTKEQNKLKNENIQKIQKERETMDHSIKLNEIIKDKTEKLEKLKKRVAILKEENDNLCRDIVSLKQMIQKKNEECEIMKENYNSKNKKAESSITDEIPFDYKNKKQKSLEDEEIEERVEQVKYLIEHKKYKQLDSEIDHLLSTYNKLKQSYYQLKEEIKKMEKTKIKKEENNRNNRKSSDDSTTNHSKTDTIEKDEKEEKEEKESGKGDDHKIKKNRKLETQSFFKENEKKKHKKKGKRIEQKNTLHEFEEFSPIHDSVNEKDSENLKTKNIEKQEMKKKTISKKKKRKNKISKRNQSSSIQLNNDSHKEALLSSFENEKQTEEVMTNDEEIKNVVTNDNQSNVEKPEEAIPYDYKNNFFVNFFMNQYPNQANKEKEKEKESEEEEEEAQAEGTSRKNDSNDITMKAIKSSSEELEIKKHKFSSETQSEEESEIEKSGFNDNEKVEEEGSVKNIVEENVFNVFNKFFY